jgi:hypothetical protein
MAYLKVLSRNSLGESDKNHEKRERIADDSIEVQTRCLLKWSLERYCYTNCWAKSRVMASFGETDRYISEWRWKSSVWVSNCSSYETGSLAQTFAQPWITCMPKHTSRCYLWYARVFTTGNSKTHGLYKPTEIFKKIRSLSLQISRTLLWAQMCKIMYHLSFTYNWIFTYVT